MKVLLGVTGGIAAYKAAELVRTLQNRGVEVQVVMTASAEEFIRPLTFAALTGRPVLGSLWQPDPQVGEASAFDIEHIAVAQEIDALVIAPATANTLARLAHGLADDLLTTVYLATDAPVILAPAMNVNMWNHAATQANLKALQERGASVVAPGAGYLACGMVGGGRLAEIERIADAVLASQHADSIAVHDLQGETILITAGGTREPVDAVRFLGNRSSGKMGHALAEEAARRGAEVILISAASLPAPKHARMIRVSTAEEMLQAVRTNLASASMVIKAAAVADFRPATVTAGKLRRAGSLTLELEPTPDILAEIVRCRKAGTLVVGFAAETGDLLENGRGKLLRKGTDAMVVNDVSGTETGFDSDENAGWFLTPDAAQELPRTSKARMASAILTLAAGLRKASLVLA